MSIDHAHAIRAQRDASNRAIAAHDAELVVMYMTSDVTVSVANGPVLKGLTANRDAFVEQFSDRSFRTYLREPSEVVVHDPPTHATERGRWTGTWRTKAGEHMMRGTYVAKWRLTDIGWCIQSEAFVASDT